MRMRMSMIDVGMRLGDDIDPFQLANVSAWVKLKKKRGFWSCFGWVRPAAPSCVTPKCWHAGGKKGSWRSRRTAL
jgi:hypothetical protein